MPAFTTPSALSPRVQTRVAQRGADPNLHTPGKPTPLAAAANTGRYELVELLLQHGADVHARDEYFGTSLKAALQGKGGHVVKLLVDHGLDEADAVEAVQASPSYWSHVRQALDDDRCDALRWLLFAGGHRVAQLRGLQPLIGLGRWAVDHNDIEALELLARHAVVEIGPTKPKGKRLLAHAQRVLPPDSPILTLLAGRMAEETTEPGLAHGIEDAPEASVARPLDSGSRAESGGQPRRIILSDVDPTDARSYLADFVRRMDDGTQLTWQLGAHPAGGSILVSQNESPAVDFNLCHDLSMMGRVARLIDTAPRGLVLQERTRGRVTVLSRKKAVRLLEDAGLRSDASALAE